jgi:hypothetical protein
MNRRMRRATYCVLVVAICVTSGAAVVVASEVGKSRIAHASSAAVLRVPRGRTTILRIKPPATVRKAGRRELDRWYFGRRVASGAGCAACHRIGESGKRGPGVPLTYVGTRFTERELAKILRDAPAPMPSVRLPDDKLRPLIRFLALLRGKPGRARRPEDHKR